MHKQNKSNIKLVSIRMNEIFLCHPALLICPVEKKLVLHSCPILALIGRTTFSKIKNIRKNINFENSGLIRFLHDAFHFIKVVAGNFQLF